MEIYLIRHTKPDIVKGTCYGQADIGTTDSFLYEASCIQQHIPAGIQTVYSSPLRRCRQLAEFLFPEQSIFLDDRLKEIHCGEWEMRLWDEIEKDHLQHWMQDSLNVRMPSAARPCWVLALLRRVPPARRSTHCAAFSRQPELVATGDLSSLFVYPQAAGGRNFAS